MTDSERYGHLNNSINALYVNNNEIKIILVIPQLYGLIFMQNM